MELSLPPLCSVFPVLSLSIRFGIQNSQRGEPHLIPSPNSRGIFFPKTLWDFQVGNPSSSIGVESSRIQANSSCCYNINQDFSSLRTWEKFFPEGIASPSPNSSGAEDPRGWSRDKDNSWNGKNHWSFPALLHPKAGLDPLFIPLHNPGIPKLWDTVVIPQPCIPIPHPSGNSLQEQTQKH